MSEARFDGLLLHAARRDAPRPDAKARALERALAALPAPVETREPAPAEPRAEPSSRGEGGRALLFGGCAVIGLCAFVLVLTWRDAPERAQAEPVKTVAVAEAPGAAPLTLVVEDTPSAPPITASPAAKGSARAPIGSTAGMSEGDELELVARAKKQLASGSPHAALQALDLHAARFPSGALSEEAEALRVEALVADGNAAGARRVGEAYLGRHPHGAYARRVTAVLDSLR